MLLLMSFLAVVAAYVVSRVYAGDDNRLPPASTQRGKEARIILGIILTIIIFLMFLYSMDTSTNGTSVLRWFILIIPAIGLPLYRYLNSKDHDK